MVNDDYEQIREGWERMNGLDVALAAMRKRFTETGGLPRSLKAALSQGVDGAISRYKETIAGLALVAALFLVGSLEQTINPPDIVQDRLWSNDSHPDFDALSIEHYAWDGFAIAYGALLIAADACFFFCIMFYGHMTHYLSYMFHCDADFFVWLMKVDFEQYISKYSAVPLVLGLILYSLSIMMAMLLLYPWFIVVPIHAGGLALSIHLGFTHSKLGSMSLDTFIRGQTDKESADQIDLLLRIHEARAERWRKIKAALKAEQDPTPATGVGVQQAL